MQTERPAALTGARPGEFASPHADALGANQIAMPNGYVRTNRSSNASANFDRLLEAKLAGRDFTGLPGIIPGQ